MLRLALSVTVVAVLLSPLVVHADEVVVYSARNEHLIKPLFDRYTQETGCRSVTSPTRKVRCSVWRLRERPRPTC